MSDVNAAMVRRWVERFRQKNGFTPSVPLCAEYFGIDRAEAERLMNEVFVSWTMSKRA